MLDLGQGRSPSGAEMIREQWRRGREEAIRCSCQVAWWHFRTHPRPQKPWSSTCALRAAAMRRSGDCGPMRLLGAAQYSSRLRPPATSGIAGVAPPVSALHRGRVGERGEPWRALLQGRRDTRFGSGAHRSINTTRDRCCHTPVLWPSPPGPSSAVYLLPSTRPKKGCADCPARRRALHL
jgi:hypothetical protein